MRFLYTVVACLAVASAVTAEVDIDSDQYDFDISGGALTSTPVKQVQKQDVQPIVSSPVQQQQVKALPVQQKQFEQPIQSKQSIQTPIQSAPVKQPVQQPSTIMLQPILLMPKQQKMHKARKNLSFDIDRAMAYRVSPRISAQNSRSVNVAFTPVLNAKMRNIQLEEQTPESDLNAVFITSPQKQFFHSVQAPKQFAAPLQEQAPLQQSDFQSKYQSIQDEQHSVSPSEFSAISSYHLGGSTDNLMLSDISVSLPHVPITHRNLVKLGLDQPKTFNVILRSCIETQQQQQLGNDVCNKVKNVADLLMTTPSSGLSQQTINNIAF